MTISMVEVYYGLVKAGRRDIESVPEQDNIRATVQAKLNEEIAGTEQ